MDILDGEIHDTLVDAAADLLTGLMHLAHRPPGIVSDKERGSLERVCEICTRVIRLNPTNWGAMFNLGIAHKILRDAEAAHAAFSAAYAIEKGTAVVGHELASACLAIGRCEEALQVSIQTLALHPDDPESMSMLALAQMMNGQLEPAHATITRAVALKPDDEILSNVLELVTQCRTGRRAVPSRLPL